MMAVRLKLILFLLLTTHLIKVLQAENKPASSEDFRFNYQPQQIKQIDSPTIRPIIWNPSFSHHIFKFSNVGLQKIGRHFINSNDIIDLSLDNNNISDISPTAFRNIRNLRHLNLSGNKIPTGKLLSLMGNDKLQTLIIDNNNDTSNHNTVLKESEIFGSLEHLHLRNSQLHNFQIPLYVATPILSHLYLSNNSINIGNSIFDNIPPSLTHLYLDRNLIDQVEPEKLRHIQELVMDNNIITTICFDECQEKSISLRNAVRLQNLSLARNLISEVSADAFNDMNQLFNLDLSGNEIANIAKDTFNNTFRITSLSMADNILTTVPYVCSMLYLKSLNLTGNRINTIFSNTFCHLRELEYLYLSNNIITTIETRAFQLQNLKYLDLSRNRLKQLPVQWVHSRYIQELHFERNNFTNLDDLKLFDIGSLKNVYLDENPMLTLKAEYFKFLPEHLILHLKNMHVEDDCSQCQCNNDDDDDNDIDDDDQDYQF